MSHYYIKNLIAVILNYAMRKIHGFQYLEGQKSRDTTGFC